MVSKYVVAVIAVFIFLGPLSAAELISLGPGEVLPWGISGDGSTVVGQSGGGSFKWTRSTGVVSLGVAGAAQDASFDGGIVVGVTGGSEAFRWTASTGVVGFGDLPGGSLSSQFRGVSADGSVAAGSGTSQSGIEAVRWTEATGMVGLGDLPGGIFQSQAMSVSGDGSVVVGASFNGPDLNAFIWTQQSGMETLSGLSGRSVATDVSANGRVVVGQVGSQPFRWTQEGGMVGLGHLPGKSTSAAWAVSDDGSFIVGVSDAEAFVWTQDTGMQSLESVLTFFGADVTDWNLYIPTAISFDGRVITGYGSNSQGSSRGWVAVVPEIPEPPTYLLGITCLIIFCCISLHSAISRRTKKASFTLLHRTLS